MSRASRSRRAGFPGTIAVGFVLIHLALSLLVGSAHPCIASSGRAESPVQERLQADIRFMTDESIQGRAPGGPGIEEVAARIAEEFRQAGLQPMPGADDYALPFTPKPEEVRNPLEVEPEIPWGEIVLKNVAGVLPGSGPEAPAILIGAHYDSNGPARDGGYFPGADDNASGVAALLELARRLPEEGPFRNTLIFAAFSGEEEGLIGSNHLVASRPELAKSMLAMLNFDAVGRMVDQTLYVIGSGTAVEFPDMLKGVALGFDLNLITPETGPFASDQVPFFERGVPVLHFFTGPNPDYDRVTDTEDKIDYEGMETLVDFTQEIAVFLADRDQPLTFVPPGVSEAPPSMAGHGAGRRVSLGSIPDFSRESGGVLLAGVMPGSPAEGAGLAKGDLLVSFGGEPVDNLSDLTVLLKQHQPGDTVEVVVDRGEERLTRRVVLEERH